MLVRFAATIEGKVPDLSDGIADRNSSQAIASCEQMLPDARNALADYCGSHRGASANAANPMFVTLSGMLTLFRLPQ